MLRCDFCCYENLLPRDATGTDAFANAALVSICLRRVNMAVSDFNGGADSIRNLIVINKPCPKRKLGNNGVRWKV